MKATAYPLIGIPCYTDRVVSRDAVRFCMGEAYCQAVRCVGGLPFLVPLLADEHSLQATLNALDGLILAGGGDVDPQHYGQERRDDSVGIDPVRDTVELWLARQALRAGVPVLAICRGVQVLNVACGGTLYQDITAQVAGAQRHSYYPGYARNHLAHPVEVQKATRLASLMGDGTVWVNSFHHQALEHVGSGLRVSALSQDGLIEGVETVGGEWVIGVQWHPEELVGDDARMERLFSGLIAAAREPRRRSA